MALVTFPITLETIEDITPSVRQFAFKKQDGSLLSFIPGQFITINFELDDKLLRRSYSIATIAGDTDLIEFAACFVEDGPGSNLLWSLKPGDTVFVTGPHGKLVLREESPKRYIFVATSTGVTPYRSMLNALDDILQKEPLSVIVLQGVQYKEDLLYKDDFIEFSKKHPKFTFRAQYSREKLSAPEPYEHEGYVQHAFDELDLDPLTDVVYLCGNPDMVDEAFAKLKDNGWDIHNIRREKYISK